MKRNLALTRIGSATWVLAAVGVVSLALLVYADRAWRDNLRRYVPLLDNLMRARVNLATGHLQLEELIAGDETIHPEDVCLLFHQADQAIDHCLTGTSPIPNLVGLALTDRALMDQLRNLKPLLDKLSTIGRERLLHRKASGIGSPSDQKFDATLGELEHRAVAIDQSLHRRLGEIMVHQREVHAATLGLWGFFLAATCGGLQFLGTRRKRAQKALHESEKNLSLIYRTVDDVLFQVRVEPDGGFRFSSVNQAFQDATGLRADQVVGRRIEEVIPEESLAVVRGRYVEAIQQNRTVKWEEASVYPAGVKTGHVTITPVVDEEGICTHLIGSVHDITDRKRAEASARAAQERLLEQQRNETVRAEAELDKLREQLVKRTRLATIGQVAASIAHELRNPLGAVRNAAYLLKRRSIGREAGAAEYLDIIDQEVAAADRIIRDLLEMSRTKAPIKQSVDLGKKIRESLERVQPNQDLRCRWALEPDPFRVEADSIQLGQVLFNLLSNAAQAMAGRGEIVVSAYRSADQDTILIHDSGPGIAAEHRNRVFEPLFSTHTKGTGLGLTICRQIIEHHGGTLDLADDGGSGATFRIRLPRSAPD